MPERVMRFIRTWYAHVRQARALGSPLPSFGEIRKYVTVTDRQAEVARGALRLRKTFDRIDISDHDVEDLVVITRVALGMPVPQDVRDRCVGLTWKP